MTTWICPNCQRENAEIAPYCPCGRMKPDPLIELLREDYAREARQEAILPEEKPGVTP